MDELWNKQLTRENITDFYNQTVTMVYPSVFDITKETTRAENAIIKSYLDIYSKRESVEGPDVIYVFGDLLLKNAKDVVAMYPLPDNLNFAPRMLDEYTRNSMLEKIITKIDSRGFKVAEFISSDSHKNNSSSSMRKYMDVFPITPLLVFEIVIVSVLIWLVSLAAIKVPYSKDQLINEQSVFETNSLQEKYVTAMQYYPLNADPGKSFIQQPQSNNLVDQGDQIAPSINQDDQTDTEVTGETIPLGGDEEPGEDAEPGEGAEPGEVEGGGDGEGDGAEPGEGDNTEPSATRG